MDANDWLKRLNDAEDAYLDSKKLGSAVWHGADHAPMLSNGGGWRGVVNNPLQETPTDQEAEAYGTAP